MLEWEGGNVDLRMEDGDRKQDKCGLCSVDTCIQVGKIGIELEIGIELVTGVTSVWERQRQDAMEVNDRNVRPS